MISTLDIVQQLAASRGAQPAIVSSSGTRSYADLLAAASETARELATNDLRVVALAADNGPQWLAADLATQLCDVAIVPLPSFFSREQVLHALEDSGADSFIGETGEPFARATDASEWSLLAELPGGLSLFRRRHAFVAELPPRTAKISYTSGTTGRPKGVCLTRAGMDAVAESLRVAVADLDITRHLCVLPLPTLLENIAGVYAPLRNGADIVVPSLRETGLAGGARFDVATLLRCIEAYEPDSIILLPQMLSALVTAIENGAQRPQGLRFIAVGGARVSTALLGRADRLGLPVYEGYGLTECGSVVALNTPAARRIGSVGKPLPHAQVDIDSRGEIRVAGPSVSGYVGGSHVAARLATGDLGRFDSDGFLYVNGRRKNVFITSFGRNVSPEWVETELTEQSPIAQATVFGEARPWNVAVIVPRGAGVTLEDVQAAIARANRRLPDYAQVGDWLFAEEPFTPGNGLLTQNGRNRRSAIWNRYRQRLDALYDDKVGRMA